MKHPLFALLSTLLLLTAGYGCATQPTDRSLEAWLAEDPDSCLWYHTGLYPSLVEARRYDSLERMYVRLLQAMPAHPKTGPDTEYLTGWVISYFYNAQILQDKTGGGVFCDSLMRSGNAFYASTMRPELLSEAAKFYLAANRRDKVDSVTKEFLALPPVTDPRREARNCHKMAWAVADSGIGTEVSAALVERAVAACRRAKGKVGNEGEIYAHAGYLRYRNGDYEEAVERLQEGIEWFRAHPRSSDDGPATAYSDLGNVYREVGLTDEAFAANSEAIRYSRRMDGWLLEEHYRFRAALHAESGRPDSALYYVRQAAAATPESARSYFLPLLAVEHIGYLLAAYPDSAASQAAVCRDLMRDTTVLDPVPLAQLHAFYGETLLATPGRETEGIRHLEHACRAFFAGSYPKGIVRTCERLLGACFRTGQADRFAALYPRYAAVRDSLLDDRSRKAAIGAAIRYQTHRKEQENRLLAMEIALKNRTLTMSRMLSGLLLVLLFTGAAIVRQRHRYLRRIGEERLAQIGRLLRMSGEGEPSHADATLAGREEKTAAAATLAEQSRSDLRRKLSSDVFNTDKEAEFRRSFTALYPGYLPALKRIAGHITRTDELLAMLLYLDLSNDEIALTLGISRSGVNKARSRMRKRLGLESEQKLERYLQTIRP